MDQFAILCFLPFLYILNASAHANRKEVSKIKGARSEPYVVTTSMRPQVFNDGNVYLYELTGEDVGSDKWYIVGNGSDRFSDKFQITEPLTVVIKRKIIISWISRTITLIFEGDADSFTLYQKLLPLGNLPIEFIVTKVFQDTEKLTDVTVITAKEIDDNMWLLVAVVGDEPQLIFPSRCVTPSSNEESGVNVSLTIDVEPEINITAEFDDPAERKRFSDFVSEFNHEI